MEQIRFSQPPENNHNSGQNTGNNQINNESKKGNSKKIVSLIIKIIGIIAVIVVLLYVGMWAKYSLGISKESSNDFYAVFLSNGQVYFGKLASKDSKEFVINNVYYLQSDTQSQNQLSEPKFTLIKLGKEVHGPTDEMYINTNSILFYEKLRDDSSVVKSIQSKVDSQNL